MRASYRWSALGNFGLWMLLVLFIGKNNKKYNLVVGGVLIGLIGLNLPNLGEKWASDTANRKMFFDIDAELAATLENHLSATKSLRFCPTKMIL